MAEPSTLGRRIEHIIADHRDRRPLGRRSTLVAALAAGLALAGLTSAQVRDVSIRPAATPTQPAAPVAITPGTVTDPATPVQISLESTFISIDQGEFDFKTLDQFGPAHSPTVGTGASGASDRWLGGLDVPAVLKTLAKKSGYELLSTPGLTVLSGKMAHLVEARELRYPQSYSDTGGGRNFTVRNIGLELAALPTAAADGHTINLHLNPRVTQFDGYVHSGTKEAQPVFSTREIVTDVELEDGATVVMGGPPIVEHPNTTDVLKTDIMGKPITEEPHDPKKQMLLVFVTAKFVRQGEGPAQVRNGEFKPATTPTTPAIPLAITPGSVTAPPTPVQIALEANFVRIDQGEFNFKTLDQFGTAHPATVGVGTSGAADRWVGGPDVPAVLRTLAQKQGYELLSSPSVTVASGQPANITVAQELRYPQSYSNTGEGQDFTTRNVGIELAATATVAADGHTITLQLHPRVTKFVGFVEYGTKEFQPVFSTHAIDTEVDLQDGATVVMGGLTLQDGAMVPLGGLTAEKYQPPTKNPLKPDRSGKPLVVNNDDPKKQILLFIITARIVKQHMVAKQ